MFNIIKRRFSKHFSDVKLNGFVKSIEESHYDLFVLVNVHSLGKFDKSVYYFNNQGSMEKLEVFEGIADWDNNDIFIEKSCNPEPRYVKEYKYNKLQQKTATVTFRNGYEESHNIYQLDAKGNVNKIHVWATAIEGTRVRRRIKNKYSYPHSQYIACIILKYTEKGNIAKCELIHFNEEENAPFLFVKEKWLNEYDSFNQLKRTISYRYFTQIDVGRLGEEFLDKLIMVKEFNYKQVLEDSDGVNQVVFYEDNI
ncbi:MAG: hypothetical protein ACPG49_07645 [Chitinophagales bacterium]